LERHPAVLAVYYPGLPSHPGHATAVREMTGGLFGGMLSLRTIGGQEGAVAFTNALTVFTRATSLGGTESLVEHRRSVERPVPTSPPDLVRASLGSAGGGGKSREHFDHFIKQPPSPPTTRQVSVGLEDPSDLVRDALSALDTILAKYSPPPAAT
jgi:cystathionine beta-lyase/cystathionine gamma-synthase